MQGLITLDFGNTNPHAGLFQKSSEEWTLIKTVPFKELSLYLDQLGMTPHNTSIVLSEVKAREEDIQNLQGQGFHITRVKDYWKGSRFAGMPVHYAQSLGEDRLIDAFYVYKKLKSKALIIDAGTYVTMDVVTEQGLLGGYIIPGIKNYFQSFENGEQLKDVQLKETIESGLPTETMKAMARSYEAFGTLAQKLIQENQLTNIFITGGASEYWEKLLQTQNAKASTDKDLIHRALHFWMTTQIEIL